MSENAFEKLKNSINGLTESIEKNQQALSEKIYQNKLDARLENGEITQDEAFAEKVDFVKGEMIPFYCTSCGGKIKIHEKTEYTYCPLCGEKVSTYECQKGNFAADAIERVDAKVLYDFGVKAKPNKTDLIKAAAKKGHRDALIYVACEEIDGGNHEKALEYASRANETQNGDALCLIAICRAVLKGEFEEALDSIAKARKLGIKNSYAKRVCDNAEPHIHETLAEIKEEERRRQERVVQLRIADELESARVRDFAARAEAEYNRMLGISKDPAPNYDDCDNYGRAFGSGLPPPDIRGM